MSLLLLHEKEVKLVRSKFSRYRTRFFFYKTKHFNVTYELVFIKIKAREIAGWTCTSLIKPAGDAGSLAASNSLAGDLPSGMGAEGFPANGEPLSLPSTKYAVEM